MSRAYRLLLLINEDIGKLIHMKIYMDLDFIREYSIPTVDLKSDKEYTAKVNKLKTDKKTEIAQRKSQYEQDISAAEPNTIKSLTTQYNDDIKELESDYKERFDELKEIYSETVPLKISKNKRGNAVFIHTDSKNDWYDIPIAVSEFMFKWIINHDMDMFIVPDNKKISLDTEINKKDLIKCENITQIKITKAIIMMDRDE